MRFTETEFETMVNELLYRDPISFDMLCKIAEKTLRPTVVYWCDTDNSLRGRGLEDDIMQEVYLRLMKKTIGYFLLRPGVEGPYNNNPEGFEDWMFTVANNIKRDFANKVRNNDFNTEDTDKKEISIPFENYDVGDRVDTLKQSFEIVLSSNGSIYKILTWLAQSIFIINFDISKIESNDMIIHAFENKTLYEMYDMILYASKSIPWIVITEQQNRRILSALDKKKDREISYGEIKYSEFFMKLNGEPSGKKSISDWMNRMNNIIKKELNPDCDTIKIKSKKINPVESGDEKRRGGDGASDN